MYYIYNRKLREADPVGDEANKVVSTSSLEVKSRYDHQDGPGLSS